MLASSVVMSGYQVRPKYAYHEERTLDLCELDSWSAAWKFLSAIVIC